MITRLFNVFFLLKFKYSAQTRRRANRVHLQANALITHIAHSPRAPVWAHVYVALCITMTQRFLPQLVHLENLKAQSPLPSLARHRRNV